MKKLLLTTVLAIASIVAFCQATGLPLGDFPTGGSLGPASTTIDVISLINVAQTTPGQTILMPTPSNLTAGKNVTINNTGTVPFTIVPGGIITPGTGVIYRWTGAWSVTGAGMLTTAESANKAYTGPASGSPDIPSFRPLVSDDIPTLSASTKISGLATVATSNNYNDLSNKPTIPTNTNQLTNGAGYITGINSSMVTTALGFTPYNSTNPNGYISNLSSFTTANLTENTNLYYTDARARLSISAGTGISYNSSTGQITNSAPDQTVSLTAGPGISITGTYPNFTIGLVTPTINNAPGRTANSNFTISATKFYWVSYSVLCTVTNPLLAGSSTASAFLEYSTNGGSSWNTPVQIGNSSAVGVAVAIAITNGQTVTLTGAIPANGLVRIRTTTTGTASVSIPSQQEWTIY